jgi:anti-anti-sigma factor
MLSFTDSIEGKNAEVLISGDLTAGNSEPLRSRLKAIIEGGVINIVFDLSGLDAIDSSGIGLLAAVFNSVSKIQGTFKIVGVSADMYQFFINLHLNLHFPIEKKT